MQGCSNPRNSDPRLEWAYSIGPDYSSDVSKSGIIPSVHLRVVRAQLGAVIREISSQSALTVIYPENYDAKEISGNFDGPADSILDALARREDLRFQLTNGVGIIGKPLPDDRTIAAIRVTFEDPVPSIQPLLSDGGKVSYAAGVVLISDRSETVQRVVAALQAIKPRLYVVQLLEIFTNQGFNVSASIEGRGSAFAPPLNDVFNSQVSAALDYNDSFLGRTWTSVISDGKIYKNFLGGTETRKTSTVGDRFVTDVTTTVQTGWHLDAQILDNRVSGFIYQDASDDINYRIEFSVPRPGLYLVHSSDISSRGLKLGFPSSSVRNAHLKRYIWIRYLPLGGIKQAPPEVGSNEPSEPPKPFTPPAPASR